MEIKSIFPAIITARAWLWVCGTVFCSAQLPAFVLFWPGIFGGVWEDQENFCLGNQRNRFLRNSQMWTNLFCLFGLGLFFFSNKYENYTPDSWTSSIHHPMCATFCWASLMSNFHTSHASPLCCYFSIPQPLDIPAWILTRILFLEQPLLHLPWNSSSGVCLYIFTAAQWQKTRLMLLSPQFVMAEGAQGRGLADPVNPVGTQSTFIPVINEDTAQICTSGLSQSMSWSSKVVLGHWGHSWQGLCVH